MDNHGMKGIDVGALLLACAQGLADLAEAGLEEGQPQAIENAAQQMLDSLARGLSVPLRLTVGAHAWQAGQGTVKGTCLSDKNAGLAGLPHDLPAPVSEALKAVLRSLQALFRRQDGLATRQLAAQQADAKIARRDELLRRLFDLSPLGIVLIDYTSGQIIEANTAFMSFGDWPRDALIGTPIRSILPAGHEAVVERTIADVKEGGRFGPIDQSFQRPDGSHFPSVLRGFLLTTGYGQRILWVMVEDISEMRAYLAEVRAVRDEALRFRAELHSAVQALPHGFMLFDAQDRIVMVNACMKAMYPALAHLMEPGGTYAEVLRTGHALNIWAVPEDEKQAMVDTTLAERTLPVSDRLTGLTDGRVIRALDRQISNGGRVGLRIDVTAEHESKERLTHVIEGSQAGTWECDFLTWENRVNARWASMLGWTCEELAPITLNTWRDLLHPEDVEHAMACLSPVTRGEADLYEAVFRLRHKAGHWVWVQSRATVSMRGSDGLPLRLSGVHVDVSALKAAEERLQQIIEGAEAGIWHHDMLTGLCHVNDIWVGMLGYTLEELGPVTDAVWQGLLHPDDWIMLNRNMEERFSSGTRHFEDELRLRHKAGHWVWVASRGQVTEWDMQGNPTATSGVHLDISARKGLEVDLRAERDFLATLMETSGSGILAVDEAARVVFFNREVQSIFELPAEALQDQLCDPVALRIMDSEGHVLPFSAMPCRVALSSGQMVRDVRLRLGMLDGRVKVVSVNATVLPDPVMSARVVCTVTDITAASQAEDDLRAAIDRAEAASRAKSQFLANMSHELRTPLNGVLGMAELLAAGDLDGSQRGMLGAIRESGAHLLSVVNDLLDLAKIESGKLVLELAPMNLADLASRIEAMHGLSARRKAVALSITLGPGTERLRRGDAKRVLQVLHNLVGNAVKFTEAGAVTVTLAEEPSHPGRIRITVADTGIGMTRDQTEHVFEEFTQGDESITRRFGGTGLGLPIVRRLVGLMDGEITLVSAHGEGTTVTVSLPMPAEVGLPSAVWQQAEAPAQHAPLKGLRALLAEDNATNRLIIRTMLARLGISVTQVCDGDEAVEAWAPDLFDVLLLDISMPRKDGLTALAELQHKAGAAGLPPVLAVTANAMAQHLQDYRRAGFSDVVTKPVTLEALAGAIARTRPKIGALS